MKIETLETSEDENYTQNERGSLGAAVLWFLSQRTKVVSVGKLLITEIEPFKENKENKKYLEILRDFPR